MDFEKKVSICMIVRNEEKNLDRCLKSLLPVIEAGLAELIIVDTGSEDNTVEIAKQYTKRVYHHPWTDNFAEMRNISISYARGEWIWIIDADEEVINPEEMVSLFQKDLSKYNTLSVTVRNYLNTPGEKESANLSICVSKRGFRNSGDFKYVGAIHNQPLAKEPSLMTEIILDHYGYIWEDKEFTRKKFDRTAGILQKELEKNPENIYYQFQLAVSWATVDKKRALEEMRKAYKLINKLPVKKRGDYLYVYGIYARIANMNERYLETIAICKEGLTYSKDYIDLWFAGGYAYRAINDIENALIYFYAYVKLFDRFKHTKIAQDPAFTFYHADDQSKQYAIYYLSLLEFEKGNLNAALKHATDLEPSDLKIDSILKICLNDESRNYDLVINCFNEILNNKNEELKNKFFTILEANFYGYENKYPDLYQRFVNFYAKNDFSDPYYYLNLVRLSLLGKLISGEIPLEQLLNLPFRDLPDYYGDVVYYLIKANIELGQFACFGFDENINNLLKYAMAKYSDFQEVLKEYLSNNDPGEEMEKLRYWVLLARYVLLSEKLEPDEYRDLFDKYVNRGITYMQKIYQPDVMQEEMVCDVKNDEQRFFIYLFKARTVKEVNKKAYVSYLRKALKVFPMKTGIEQLLKEIQKEIFVEDEMEILKAQFKKNIQKLIEFNKFAEAEGLIEQYEQIVPDDDVEILFYKSELLLRKNQRLLN